MASPLAPEEGAAAYAAVSKNVDAGQGGTVRRPGPLRVLHPDVSEFLLGTRRRRIKKQAPAMPPPAAEGEEDGGERARYGCAFEHEGAEQEKRGFAPPRLVWGKVNNHPWWPGRLFDPADASELAQKHRRRRGATLVAYFWDKTFAWADAVALRPFRGCFPRLAGQSNMSTFASAVDAALAKVARRVDVGLSCSCAGSNAIVKKQVIDSAGVGEGAYGAMVDAAWRRGAPTNTSTPLPLPIIFLFRCGKLAGRHSLLRPSVSAGSPSASPIVIVRSPHSPRTQISSPKAFLFTTKMKPESCRSLFWNEGGIHSRKYNTYADDEDKRSPPLPTYADDEDKLSPPPPAPISLLNSPYDPPNLKSFSIGYGESAKLLERLDHDIRLLVQEGLDIAKMKSLYKELVRPSLVSSCLLHAEPLNSPNTKVLDDKYRETLKRPPAYITTLDLMTKLFSLHPTKCCKYCGISIFEYLIPAIIII